MRTVRHSHSVKSLAGVWPPVKAPPVRLPPRARNPSGGTGDRASWSWRRDGGDCGRATWNVHLTPHEPPGPPSLHRQ